METTKVCIYFDMTFKGALYKPYIRPWAENQIFSPLFSLSERSLCNKCTDEPKLTLRYPNQMYTTYSPKAQISNHSLIRLFFLSNWAFWFCHCNIRMKRVTDNPKKYLCKTNPGRVSEWVLSKFNGTSTPKGLYRANSSRYSLNTALCESIRYQAKSEQNVRQDLIPRVRHGEAALGTPTSR